MNHLVFATNRFSRSSLQFCSTKPIRFRRSSTWKSSSYYRFFSTETPSQVPKIESKKTNWRTNQNGKEEEFFFYNKRRNIIYLVSAIGSIIVTVCAIHFTLTSQWFDDKLKFDENDPNAWPLDFLQYIAIVGEVDRYALNPKYLEILSRGSLNNFEEVQKACVFGLSTLIADPVLCSELGAKLPLTKILESLRTAQSMDFLTSVCELLDGLSMKGSNAKFIVNKQTLPVLSDMCLHPNADIQGKIAGMMANLSRNTEVTENMIRLFPPLFSLYAQATDEWTKNQAKFALKNILIHGSGESKYQDLMKRATADISAEELDKIKSYSEESMLVHRLKSIAAAAVVGAGYGFARWSIRAGARGISGDNALQLIKKKAPITSVGAVGLYLYWAFDDSFFRNVVEPLQKSESSLLFGNFVWGFTSLFTVLWVSQGLCPYTVVPSIAYPMYYFIKNGDRRYNPK